MYYNNASIQKLDQWITIIPIIRRRTNISHTCIINIY